MRDLFEWPLTTREAGEFLKHFYAPHQDGCRCTETISQRYLKARLLAKYRGVDVAGWPLRDAP